MHSWKRQLSAILLVALASPLEVAAQTRAPQQVLGTAVISGPASLEATMTSSGAWLRWPPVVNARGYNITRVNYAGSPEMLISSRPHLEYVTEGSNCLAGNDRPYCVYFDNQFRTTAVNLTVTYRVYAIVPTPKGAVASAPSPTAAVIWNCPNCPKLP